MRSFVHARSGRRWIYPPPLAYLTAMAASIVGAACGDPLVIEVSPPARPVITAIEPGYQAVGDPAASVTVYGTRYSPNSVIRWDGRELPSSWQENIHHPGAGILTARVPLSDLDEPKHVAITVFTPSQAHPPGVSSDPWPYRVEYPRASSCHAIDPLFAAVGAPVTEFLCRGSGYMAGTAVFADSTVLEAETVDFHTLRFKVPASLMAGPGTRRIRTLNAAHEGDGWTMGGSLHVVQPVVVGTGGKQIGRGCILDAYGVLQCWDSIPRPVAEPLRFLELAASLHFSCAKAVEGPVYCWGANYYGQLGTGLVWDSPWEYTTGPTLPVAGEHELRALAVGSHHACALAPDGAAWCWGNNEYGQLGTDEELEVCGWSTPCAPRPVPVAGGLHFVALAAGASHTCGLEQSGIAYCWGSDEDGQLGNGPGRSDARLPQRVDSEMGFAAITAHSTITCALTAEGAAFCWGGGGWTEPPAWEVPTPVAEWLRFEMLVVGPTAAAQVCGITLDGAIFCKSADEVRSLGQGHRWTEIRLGYGPPNDPTYFKICGFTTQQQFLCWGEWSIWHDHPDPVLGFSLISGPQVCSWVKPGMPAIFCYPSPTPVFGVAGQERP
jgi:hypothetical protein